MKKKHRFCLQTSFKCIYCALTWSKSLQKQVGMIHPGWRSSRDVNFVFVAFIETSRELKAVTDYKGSSCTVNGILGEIVTSNQSPTIESLSYLMVSAWLLLQLRPPCHDHGHVVTILFRKNWKHLHLVAIFSPGPSIYLISHCKWKLRPSCVDIADDGHWRLTTYNCRTVIMRLGRFTARTQDKWWWN